MKPFYFGTRPIGPGNPCFIIAEVGVNHNGSVERAIQLIRLAREAGADAVKFQTFQTGLLVARGTAMADYQKENASSVGDQADLLRGLELSFDDLQKLFDYGRTIDMPVFSTPDEECSARMLVQFSPPAFKIGSGEITNLPFLRFMGGLGRPLILSTGMATLAETALAVEALEAGGAEQIAILHCVSAYPAPLESLNLRAIRTLAGVFPFPIGFSDHSLGYEASLGAVALGASLLEKHFTLDCSLQGPDHSSSLNPSQFAQYVGMVRNLEAAMGNGCKVPDPIEISVRAVVRKILVAAQDIPVGKQIVASDILAKRSGEAKGIQPADFEKVVGLILMRPVKQDQALTWAHFHPI